jgi:hypothetical protein
MLMVLMTIFNSIPGKNPIKSGRLTDKCRIMKKERQKANDTNTRSIQNMIQRGAKFLRYRLGMGFEVVLLIFNRLASLGGFVRLFGGYGLE